MEPDYKIDLDAKRLRIDEINREIVDLLYERFNIGIDIANIKKYSGKEVLDKSREQIIIDNIKSQLNGNNFTDEILNVFLTILQESRNIQTNIIKN